MKQKIYIFGVLTALTVFIGAIFKVNHFPGAGILLTLGLITLVLLFIPIALINHYRSEGSSKNRLLYFVTWLTCFVIFTAMLFKLQHWPGAHVLLTVAIPFPYVVFLPVFLTITSRNKNFNIYNTVFVLLLLALNSVFSAMLALNVSRERIEDSYNFARQYHKVEKILVQLPADDDQTLSVNMRIDEVIKVVNEYKELILKEDGVPLQAWNDDPYYLRRPDVSGFAAMALLNSGESADGIYGFKLVNGLKALINEMGRTPGLENLAKEAPLILNFIVPSGDEQKWAVQFFGENTLAWVLVNLEGIKTNLLFIKASL